MLNRIQSTIELFCLLAPIICLIVSFSPVQENLNDSNNLPAEYEVDCFELSGDYERHLK